MLEDIRKQALELTARETPHAIVVSPPRLKRMLAEDEDGWTSTNVGSGWAYVGLPIYRSWEVVGPVVVTLWMFHAMRVQSDTVLF